MAEKDINDLIIGTANDVHPPLYYLILKVSYSILGDNCIAWRVPSVIPTIILILFGTTTLRKKYGRKISLLFIILISFLESSIFYNTEVRMYSWANFFVFMTFWYALELTNSNNGTRKIWILFTIFGILSAYTHYYALLGIALIYIITFVRLIIKNKKNLKNIAMCMVTCILAYMPWLVLILSNSLDRTDNVSWIKDLPNILQCIYVLIGTNYLSILILVLLSIGFFILIYKNFIKNKVKINKKYLKEILNNEEVSMICLAVAIVIAVILLAIIVAIIIRPLFVSRYIFVFMAITSLCISIFVFRIFSNDKIEYLILIVALLSGMFSWGMTYKTIWENNKKTQEIVQMIEKEESDNIKLVSNDFSFAKPPETINSSSRILDYYFNYPNYYETELDYEDYLEGISYLFLTDIIDETMKNNLEEDGKKVEFITEDIFSKKLVNIYKIY